MSEKGEFSRIASIRKCPICGGELEKGFLNAPRGVYWSIEKRVLGTILLDSAMPGALFTHENLPALKCGNCGIAIVDWHGSEYTPKSFLKKCVECGKQIPIASEECQFCRAKQKEGKKKE